MHPERITKGVRIGMDKKGLKIASGIKEKLKLKFNIFCKKNMLFPLIERKRLEETELHMPDSTLFYKNNFSR